MVKFLIELSGRYVLFLSTDCDGPGNPEGDFDVGGWKL